MSLSLVLRERGARSVRSAKGFRARAALSAFGVLLLAVAAGAQEQAPNGSVDRVRAALEKPPSKLTLQDRTPDFSVHIEKRRPMQDIFDIPPWQLEPSR